MSVFSQLIGVGPNSEILTCVIKVEFEDDSKKAKVSIKNTSPKINEITEPIVDDIYLNVELASSLFDAKEINMLPQDEWEFHHDSEQEMDGIQFQYRVKPSVNHGCIRPNEMLIMTLYSDNPNFRFDKDMFGDKGHVSNPFHLGVGFRNLGAKKTEKKKLCGRFMKHPKVTTTPPPPPPPKKEPNPQTCCQVLIEGKTQLVGPALFDPNKPSVFPVTHTKKLHVWIEAVCPEKVVIAGIIKKKIVYKSVDDCGNLIPAHTIDEIPFQCMIDRPDANEGDKFEIVGAAILCDIYARPANFGIHPESGKPVAWRFIEKEIVKICIRKKTSFFPPSNQHH